MKYQFRKARITEIPQIWDILQNAILRRKKDGSEQWQDGYPNPEVIENDIKKEAGFVLTNENTIIGYVAVIINDEPAYTAIQGKWLSNEDFVVFHRIAIAEAFLGQGFSKIILKYIEEFAFSKQIYSVKADTNFDNLAMLSLFEKLGYQYCGEVFFRGGARKAFEKVLEKKN